MSRLRDILRAILISPEVLCVLLAFIVYRYVPAVADFVAKQIEDNFSIGIGVAALILAMLAFNYKESLEILNPSGDGRRLLEWPDYRMLKGRIVIALGWCVAGLAAAVAGLSMIMVAWKATLGAAILASALLAGCAATATIGLARFRIRELLVSP